MSVETRAFGSLFLAMAAVLSALAFYEHRHPCLRYSTHRVFIPELTTYTRIDGGNGNGGVTFPG
jgi:hypothetical protein